MAKIITITQQKGGAGKTTLTANLACYLSGLGHKILLVDTDPQNSLSIWYAIRQEHQEKNTLELETYSPNENISEKLKNKVQNYDFVLIDTPPHASENSNRIITMSDYVVIPAQLSPLDIWASQPILDMSEAGGIHHMLVLNRVPAQGKMSKELHDSLAQNDIPLARTTIGNRNDFVSAFLHGQGATEYDSKSKAAEEIKNLSGEIMINIVTGKTPKTAPLNEVA